MNSLVLKTARLYVASGLCVIPIRADGTKRPPFPWKEYESRLPSDAELEKWFGRPAVPCGLAVVCGRVSGGLEVLDFDQPAEWLAWQELVEEKFPGVLDSVPMVETPSGGRHVYYRTREPLGNKKLAQTEDGKTLIETRGEGGYVLAPGCPPECHPTGKGYRLVGDVGLDAVPLLQDGRVMPWKS